MGELAYIDRKTQADANSACNGTFSCAVRPKDHVHAGTGGELHEVIGEKVLAADSKYRARQVTRSISNVLVSTFQNQNA